MQFSDVSDLPGAPLMERMFLVEPMLAALAALVVGLIVFEVLRRRKRERAAIAAFAMGLVVGGAIMVIGVVTVTPYEKAREATERFVERAAKGDRDALEDMLDDRFVLMLAPDDTPRDADWMLDRVESAGMVVRSNQEVWRGGEVQQAGRAAQTRMTVRTDVEMSIASGRYASTWDFFWRREADGAWKLVRLEALSVVGQRPQRGWGDQVPLPSKSGR